MTEAERQAELDLDRKRREYLASLPKRAESTMTPSELARMRREVAAKVRWSQGEPPPW
jgi:hypothetical protein